MDDIKGTTLKPWSLRFRDAEIEREYRLKISEDTEGTL